MKRLSIFALLLFLIISSLYLLTLKSDFDYNLRVIALFSFILIILALFLNSILFRNLFNFFNIYILMFYLFTMGQSFLFLFNFPISNFDLYKLTDNNSLYISQIYTYFCIYFIEIGGVIGVPKRKINFNPESPIFDNTLKFFSLIMFAVSIFPIMYLFYLLISNFITGGYVSAFLAISGSNGLVRLAFFLSDYFIVSLFIMIIYSKKIFYKFIYSGFIFLVVLLYFSVGDRTFPISISLSLIGYFFINKQRKINLTSYISYIFLGYLFLTLIPLIGNFRNTGNLTLSILINGITNFENVLSPLFETVSILGYSNYPFVETMEIVPSLQDFAYGESYFFSLLSIFPNIFGGIHISAIRAGLSLWLKNQLNLTYGPGFSFPAEAWYNFGWFGLFLMLPFGIILSKIFNYNQNNLGKFINVIFFLIIVTSPRREMLAVIRDSFYWILLPYIVSKYLNIKVIINY